MEKQGPMRMTPRSLTRAAGQVCIARARCPHHSCLLGRNVLERETDLRTIQLKVRLGYFFARKKQ